MNGKLNINEWAVEDRPREKLLRLGAEALTNAELLAILIGSGSTTESAVDLMKHVLGDCGNNLNQLGKLTVRQLTAYHGVGEAKAVTILAACELGKRRQKERALERTQLNSAVAIYDFMLPQMPDLAVEEAWLLFMNQNFKLLRCMRLSRGGITETSVDVRVVMKEALLSGATVLALCHNHPSGNVKPSTDDDRITRRVQQACELMRIHFLDHLVITDGLYYSYQESGRL